MKKKINKLEQIDKLYSKFTEKNRDNLLKTAKTLLKVQKADIAVVDNASLPMGAKKQE